MQRSIFLDMQAAKREEKSYSILQKANAEKLDTS